MDRRATQLWLEGAARFNLLFPLTSVLSEEHPVILPAMA